MLSAAPPIALAQGQSIEVALNGQNLSSLASAAVAQPRGVTVNLLKPEKANQNELRLKITAAADAALGDREMRLIGPRGVTPPLRIFVSQYPVISEKEPNNQPSEAQQVQLPATIVGRIDGAGDVDHFRFDALKDQKLIFNVHASRIGSPLEPVVTVHSATGREMRTTLEHHGGDPVLIFVAPDDGQYVLRLRDLRYRGGANYEYRIDAGRIPFLEGVLPSSGRPGKVVEVQPVGHNLDPSENITVDLSMAGPGRIEVRAKTSLGFSNPVPFEVTELPQVVESEPNDKPETANSIALPAEVSGHMDRPADEDFFKFHLAYRQAVSVEVLAGRYGSPVNPLLQLRNAKGDVMESNDGTPDADARIARELDPGDYIVSVRDLTYAGGPGYWYRLKVESAVSVPQDFAVRFLPDAPRLHRGGNVAMWCEVKRLNGFKGDVTITPEGLPAGVTASPVVMNENASGWFTISANSDAALGTTPIRLRAAATIGTVPISHYAEPEVDGRVVQEAYLTVLEPAPFNVEAVATMSPQRIEQMNDEIRTLADKLNSADPKFEASLAQWEKKVANRPVWTVLNPAAVASSRSTPLSREPDGSILAAGGMIPAQDQYSFTARTDLNGITAVRLEVLADDRLPAHGPGAAPNGNFVLSEFKLLVSKDGEHPQPVAFRKATADFSQNNFPIAAAIDSNPETGWAVDPQQGRSHTAIFETASPIGFGEGTQLTFGLDHESIYPQHNIGRFRIAVTTADASALDNESQVPPNIAGIISTPAAQRTAEQRVALANYFRGIDPQTRAERSRLEALRGFAEPYAQMERLSKVLKTGTPQLDAEQAQWEQAMSAGAGWSVLELGNAHSNDGVQFEREPDGSLLAQGSNPPTETYTIDAATPLKEITAVLLEVLPDARLPGNGPGRADDGNFVLTRFRVAAAPRRATTQPAQAPPEEAAIESARATVEQQGFGVAGTLDEKNDTGWAIAPEVGRPSEATFYFKQPLPAADAGSVLAFTLEHLSGHAQHTIGRFRIWVTTNRQPDAALRPPLNIAAILKVPSGGRSDEQKRELAAYFRSIAPSLEPLRHRLADLSAAVPSIPFKVEKNRDGAIAVPINRLGNFSGDVRVTLEGFTSARDSDKPVPIDREFKINPLTISGDSLFGTLTFEPERRAETATRMVVLKAEAKVGDETVVEYSPAFPLTVER